MSIGKQFRKYCGYSDEYTKLTCLAFNYTNAFNKADLGSTSELLVKYFDSVSKSFNIFMKNSNDVLYSWNGTGSHISSDVSVREPNHKNRTDGMDIDYARIHKNSSNTPAVFFQWLKNKSTEHLKIDFVQFDESNNNFSLTKNEVSPVSIVYGLWDNNDANYIHKRIHKNVTLPFILDAPISNKYYTIAVLFNKNPQTESSLNIKATVTSSSASTSSYGSELDKKYGIEINKDFNKNILIDNRVWSGNGSVINLNSKSQDDWGFTHDVALVKKGRPVIFFQWQIKKSHNRLAIFSDNIPNSNTPCIAWADITYKGWDESPQTATTLKRKSLRANISTENAWESKAWNLPSDYAGFILTPQDDNRGVEDGDWYVIKIEPYSISSKCGNETYIHAIAIN